MKFLNLLAACLLAVAVVGCSEQSGTDGTPATDPANVEVPGDTGDTGDAAVDPSTGDTGDAGPAKAEAEASEGEQP